MTKHDADRKVRILDFIAATLRSRGYPPSVREIAKAVGLASTSAVHHHLLILEREGYLERGAAQSRAIRLTPYAALRLGLAAELVPQSVAMEAHVLPVIGEIAAGGPIEAYQDASETVGDPRHARALGRRLRPEGPRRFDDRGAHRGRRLRPDPAAVDGPERRHRRRPGRGERGHPEALLQGEGQDPPPAGEPRVPAACSTTTSASRASSSASFGGSTDGCPPGRPWPSLPACAARSRAPSPVRSACSSAPCLSPPDADERSRAPASVHRVSTVRQPGGGKRWTKFGDKSLSGTSAEP